MLVIGALARDLVAYLPRQASAPRATKDIDIALRTSTLDEYRELTRGLEKLSSAEHKFRISGYEVDIVPFGGLEQQGEVRFPDAVLEVVQGTVAAVPQGVRLMNGHHRNHHLWGRGCHLLLVGSGPTVTG